MLLMGIAIKRIYGFFMEYIYPIYPTENEQKRTMMNNVLKLSMIAALTMSSASVFAAPGDPVGGGQGSVTIDGSVQTNTCAVAVDKQALTVKFMKADIDKAVTGADLTNMTGDTGSTFTLTNCSGQPIKVLITPTGGSAMAMAPYWSIPGNNQLGLRLSTVSDKTTGATWSAIGATSEWKGTINFTSAANAASGLQLNPNSDTTTFPLNVNFSKAGTSSAAYTGPSTFTTGYTYNLTYL